MQSSWPAESEGYAHAAAVATILQQRMQYRRQLTKQDDLCSSDFVQHTTHTPLQSSLAELLQIRKIPVHHAGIVNLTVK